MSIRKRLSQEESRTVALEAARLLLIELGPQAVTLKAVASRIGRTHANLLHHFGSAAGLQKALAEHLAVTICATIEEAVIASRSGIGSPRDVVDLTFDAFDKEGGGALASKMRSTRSLRQFTIWLTISMSSARARCARSPMRWC
jgi:AcrR family transcriptional regulator